MKFADNVSKDNDTLGGGAKPPCTGLTPDALPEVQTPVLAETQIQGCPLEMRLAEQVTEAICGQLLHAL